jgi:tRNA dimethylallyltransferase
MVEEFTGLIAKGYDAKTIARRGIGYKYIKEFLDGEYTRDAFIEKLTIAILRYAKRQRTWNKKYLLGKVPGIELHIVES